MKNFITIVFVITLNISCHQQPKQQTKEDAAKEAERKADSIAAPYITNDLGDLRLLSATVKNQSFDQKSRMQALSSTRQKYPEYMSLISKMDWNSTNTGYYDSLELLQENYIIAKYKNAAAQLVYKQALLKVQQAEDAVQESKK